MKASNELQVEVCGRWPWDCPGVQPGVALSSMRERAQSWAGPAVIEALPAEVHASWRPAAG